MKNEKYINKIIYQNFDRKNLIKNTLNLQKNIKKEKPEMLILTHGSKRLLYPLLLNRIKYKIFFDKQNNEKNLPIFLIKQFKKKFSYIKLIEDYSFSVPKIRDDSKFFFINIDSHHNQNNWGENNFINLINKITNFYKKKKIYINLSPNNKVYFKNIVKTFKINKRIVFCYNFSFKKIINKIALSKIVIGNESGPICIAASLNKNIVSIYDKFTTEKSSKIIFKKVKMLPKRVTVMKVFNIIRCSIKNF